MDYFNQRCHDYTGLSLKQSQGSGWQVALHPDDLPRCLESWNRAIQTGESFHSEFRLKRASDGNYCWYLARALQFQGEDGSIVKWLGTSTDIDDQKRAESAQRFLAQASTLLASSLDY